MEGQNTIVWRDDRATQVQVAQLVNQSTGEFAVDVTDPREVKEWTKLLESRAAEDIGEADPARFTWPPRPVSRPAIYGGVVVATVSTFALLTGFAIWRNYTVSAELTPDRMRFRLRPPPPPPHA
ncbi:MAG: hypothetical protein LBJ65_17910 [Burkholderia sp.]|jgi:hypothetical protein|uniref:hypothetical protein n=1 Tax=Burkholderia sp. TaxID=36773 RepID=UPI0028240539|nr:hypothetical protein [Burkholderia sp.]MDR0243473.1 hypothetical protein [Burkholderia sp.]